MRILTTDEVELEVPEAMRLDSPFLQEMDAEEVVAMPVSAADLLLVMRFYAEVPERTESMGASNYLELCIGEIPADMVPIMHARVVELAHVCGLLFLPHGTSILARFAAYQLRTMTDDERAAWLQLDPAQKVIFPVDITHWLI